MTDWRLANPPMRLKLLKDTQARTLKLGTLSKLDHDYLIAIGAGLNPESTETDQELIDRIVNEATLALITKRLTS